MTGWTPAIGGRPGPRADAIADAIGADIAVGRLRTGDRLPTQRALAQALGVSPNTVMRAYAEATRRGYLEGQVGRGTYVRPSGTAALRVPADPLTRPQGGPVDLSVSLPFIGEAGQALAHTLAELSAERDLAGFLDRGTPALHARQAAAAAGWVTGLGLTADPECLVVTNGAQHGILVAMLALLRPGDALLTERLTYAPVRALARRLRLRVVALDMDDEGVLPESLEAACRDGSAKLLYCTPTLQTPTTATMGEDRRRRIARIAAAHDLVVVEDDVFGFLPPSRPSPLAAFLPGRTVFVTSVSKSMAPGLRVGYLLAPSAMLPALRTAVAMSSWMPPPLTAEVARRWIEDGTADRLNQSQRAHAARRQGMARRLLGDHPFRADGHGLHVWLPLPPHWSARAFASAAERAGVLVNPAGAFSVGSDAPSAVRLCLSHEVSDERVSRGLDIVAGLLGAPDRSDPLVV